MQKSAAESQSLKSSVRNTIPTIISFTLHSGYVRERSIQGIIIDFASQSIKNRKVALIYR